MSNLRQARPLADLPTPLNKQSELLRLATSLLNKFRAYGLQVGSLAQARQALSLIALHQLAAAGLFPVFLKGTRAGALLEHLGVGSAAQVSQDDTDFCLAAASLLRHVEWQNLISDWCFTINLDAFADERGFLKNPCGLGWLYQAILRESALTLRDEGKVSSANVASATQWFTPEWVARFIVDETIVAGRTVQRGSEPSDPLVIDPACGAGHLLVSAFEKMTAEPPGLEPRQRQIKALNGLYGLDIDPLMTHLSAFAIYLYCRRQAGVVELPAPNIFTWRTISGADTIGSFRLLKNIDAKRPTDVDGEFLETLLGEKISPVNLPGGFDAVVTNPPYLSHRNMPAEISRFLKEHYKESQYDLYAAFLSLSADLLNDGGYMGMICQQSFLSIQRYSPLRKRLSERCRLTALAQLGSGSFATRAGEKVNNAVVIFEKTQASASDEIRCWRLLDPKEKEQAEARGLHQIAPTIYISAGGLTAAIPMPYWCPESLQRLFDDLPQLEGAHSGITCSNGLFTCDNNRFVKRHDEVLEQEKHLYVPYDKGGGHKWFRTTPYMLRWGINGDDIRQFRKSRGQSVSLPGETHYFKTGVTYSYIGTRGFKARLLSENSVFDIASSSIFSDKLDQHYILGFLNSSLACFLLGVLNPTINFQIGDLRRLPFKMPTTEVEASVAKLTELAIELAKEYEELDPASANFNAEKFGREPANYAKYCEHLHQINAEECSIQNQIDAVIFEHYAVEASARQTLLADPWVVRSRQPLCKALTETRFEQALEEPKR